MESFLARYKNLLVLLSVVLVQIIGLAAQVRRPNPNGGEDSRVRLLRYWGVNLIVPPEKALHSTGHGIRSLWANYVDLRGVRRQNKDLKDQISRLELEQAALLEDARQGQRLQHLLSFQEHYVSSTLPAQVIGTAGTDQSRVLYIDKGSLDGLQPDMAVITPDGIVGKIRDTFPHTAQVLEISDQSSGAGVLLESTRLRGVLRGNELGQPQIINLLPDERIKPGERVLTSGGDQIYPRGLAVGVVDKIVPDTQNPPYVDIVIKPAANLGHLEEVLVITGTSGQMTPKEKQDLAQSATAAAALGTERAADILAQRLPSLDLPPAGQDKKADSDPDGIAPAVHPPAALHADRYTPDATPAAKNLTPGQEVEVSPSASLPIPKAAHPAASVSGAPKKPENTEAGDPKPAAPKAAPRAPRPNQANPDHANPNRTNPAQPAAEPGSGQAGSTVERQPQ